jgi:photosystem II stability/assembly factor-like uncharacterized protein
MAVLASPVLAKDAASPAPKSQPYTWREVKIGGGGLTTGLSFHPLEENLIYARTDVGGAYRWDHATSRWVSITDWIGGPDWDLTGIDSLAIDPSDPKRVYLAAGIYLSDAARNGEILRSEDKGATFERVRMPFKMGGNEPGRPNGERLAVDPNDGRVLFLGSRQAGLWRSADYGKTWSEAKGFPEVAKSDATISSDPWKPHLGIPFVVFDPQSGKSGSPTPVLYAGVSVRKGPNLFRSRDAGATWEAVPGQPEGLRPTKAVLASNGVLYVSYGDEPGPNRMEDGAVWKLDTKSDAWTNITPEKPGEIKFGYASLAVDPKNPDRLYTTTFCHWAGGDRIYRSLDGGATWINLAPGAKRDASSTPFLEWGRGEAAIGHWIADIEINPFNPDQVLYTTGATIWASSDATKGDTGGETHWTPLIEGFEETVTSDLASPPSGAPLFSALWDLDGFRHEDLTVSPKSFFTPNSSHATSLDFAEKDPNIVVRAHNPLDGATGGSVSQDNGVTWKAFPSAPGGNGRGTIAIAADGSRIVWTPEGAGQTFISKDMGATWTKCEGLPRALPVVSDRVNPQAFYAYDREKGTLFGSADGGGRFTVLSSKAPAGSFLQMRAVPGKAGLLVLATDQGLFQFDVAKKAFTPLTGPEVAPHRFGFGKAAPGADFPAIYLCGRIAGTYGFFRSDDAGKSWVRINDDRHQFNQIETVIGDPRIYGRVYIGTRGRGIIYGDIAKPAVQAK